MAQTIVSNATEPGLTGQAPAEPAATAGATRLLVAGMTRTDGELRLAELAPVAAQCGFSSDQVRSCLRRMVAAGLFEREGAGRTAVYRATARGLRLLRERLRNLKLAYRQDAGAAPWNGEWHLVGFAVPEARRDARDALRDLLITLGGAALQGGLYVSCHAWESAVRDAAKELGVEGCLTLATSVDLEVAGTREPRCIARALWPIDELAIHYERFVARYRSAPEALEARIESGQPLEDAELIPGALAMVRAWADSPNQDPFLPAELLPDPWPGREARELLLRSRRLALAARRERGSLTLFSGLDESVAV
ncbi:MAG: transcriptional regulator [Deltaproteobacteria bacterium]|nr:transcriptional regulator [Deltaproteobacteria bacterium]MBW2393502.1 transcriptional regulator [Deltaproteobacteria bacterium]